MEQLFSLLVNPFAYLVPLGVVAAMYTSWALARRQYLSVNKLFNATFFALVFGWAAAWLVQVLLTSTAFDRLDLWDLWIHPRPIIVLTGYIAIAFVVSRYILSIRYPYWRTMDMVSAALAVFLAALSIGWAIQDPQLGAFVTAIIAVVAAAAIIGAQIRWGRHGIVTAVHLLTLFGVVSVTRFLIPSWQQSTTNVEWTAIGLGGIWGLGLLAIRISNRSERVILQDIPRGVSQGFQDTFTKAFKSKRIATKESSQQ